MYGSDYVMAKSEPRISLDTMGFHDGIEEPPRGSTAVDREDMARMGRIQELRVRFAFAVKHITLD